ncbi:MAG: NAD-dependent epimerase/dehydratase family protein [Microbacterium sp.]
MKALLTGAGGMLGRSIVRAWHDRRPDDELVQVARADIDLRDRAATAELFAREAPDLVIHAAAVIGGIAAKQAHPMRYLLENLLIDSSVIAAGTAAVIPRMIYIGSAAAYPEHAAQPLTPDALLTGALEPANESYGLAKIAGIKLCELASAEFGVAYRVVMPSNLYGPDDHFDTGAGHMIAAALTKVAAAHAERAPSVAIWGDGQSRREFTYAPDLADWLVEQADEVDSWPAVMNVGVGVDHTIDHYYRTAAAVVGYEGAFVHDLDKPNGARGRLLDSTPARERGWAPPTSLHDGMSAAYAALLDTSPDHDAR